MQHSIHSILMQKLGRATQSNRNSIGEHLDDLVEVLALEVREGKRAPHQVEERVDRPGLGRALRHDLLREDVERRLGRMHAIEPPGRDRLQERGALDQLVARGRKEPSLRLSVERVPRTPDALQEGRHAPRRLHLADEVDASDVDAELERSGGDERANIPRLEPLLELQPPLLR